jgi:hypothetical protein
MKDGGGPPLPIIFVSRLAWFQCHSWSAELSCPFFLVVPLFLDDDLFSLLSFSFHYTNQLNQTNYNT